MAIRLGYELQDLQSVIVALLRSLNTSPWTDWTVVHGYGTADDYESQKPVIYVTEPLPSGQINSMSQYPVYLWVMVIGVWVPMKAGGYSELNVVLSNLLSFFRRAYDLHSKKFTVALGSTTYTSKTLIDHRLTITSAQNASFKNSDVKDGNFRSEFLITLISGGA